MALFLYKITATTIRLHSGFFGETLTFQFLSGVEVPKFPSQSSSLNHV